MIDFGISSCCACPGSHLLPDSHPQIHLRLLPVTLEPFTDSSFYTAVDITLGLNKVSLHISHFYKLTFLSTIVHEDNIIT